MATSTLKIAFTDNILSRLKPQNDKTVTKYGSKSTRYLYLFVTSSSKTFYYYRKYLNRIIQKNLGKYPQTTIAMAEEHVYHENLKYGGGEVVQDQKTLTLEQLFTDYINFKSASRSVAKTNSIFKHCQSIQHFPLDIITTEILRDLHQKFKKTPVQANRVITLIRGMYNYAIRKLMLQLNNPAANFKYNEETPRRRIMNQAEKERFFATIIKWSNPASPEILQFWSHLFHMLWLTGARRSNVMQMQYTEIDFDISVWVIPRNKSKTNRELVIPLTKEAMELIKHRRKIDNSHCDYVFPSPANPKKPLVEIKSGWRKFIRESNIQNLTVHDVRRSLGATLIMAGVDLKTTSEILGHARIDTTVSTYTPILVDHKLKALMNVYDGNRLNVRNAELINRLKSEFAEKFPVGTKAELEQFMKEHYKRMTEEDFFHEEQWLSSQAEEEDQS